MGTNKSYDMSEPFVMIPRSLADGVIAGILSPEDFQVYVYLLLRRQPVVNRVVTNAKRLGEDLNIDYLPVGRTLRRLKEIGLISYNGQNGARRAYSIIVFDWTENMLEIPDEDPAKTGGTPFKSVPADVSGVSPESLKIPDEELTSNSDDSGEDSVGLQIPGEELPLANPGGGDVPAVRNNLNLNPEENQQQNRAAAEDLIQDETTNPSELIGEDKNRAVQVCDVTENEPAQTDAEEPFRYGDPKYTDEYFAKRWEELPEGAPLYLRTATDELVQTWKGRQAVKEMDGRESEHVAAGKVEINAAVLNLSEGVNFASQAK